MKSLSEKDCKQEFYFCPTCGNLMIKLNDSGMIPQCCSKTMIRIEPEYVDSISEKHVPVYDIDGNKIVVRVGEKEHPMETDHHIDWIFVKTTKGFQLKVLSLKDSAEACFKLCKDEKIKSVYAHCSLHGLWKADEICMKDEE